ncbi:MAG: N-acetylmuramoyl-L-alanine amidase [Chloroflexota bacterium]|nr:N-acetylmuramoyl-L-alanine amidase [Chloroflexota bacterium]
MGDRWRPDREGETLLRIGVLHRARRGLLALLILIGVALLFLSGRAVFFARAIPSTTLEVTPHSGVVTLIPSAAATRPTYRSRRVGIVAGHWQYDSGAVCPDGLTEVEINVDVARRVVAILLEVGYDAEVLAEFSPDLEGYQADALVSIHADSCNIPEASGFKVARVSYSAVPEEEDRLVECLRKEYERITGLYFHEDSITFDMREYHAFYEIAPETPAAIIETGFMDADRDLLTERPHLVAEGIAEGIICFLEGPPD